MKRLEIFDPAMCCSTGVCGPSIDSELMRISTTINSLKEKRIVIKRHGLSTEPQDFVSNKTMNALLQKEGVDILPVTLLDGEVVKTKTYPTNEELSQWLEVKIASESPWKSNSSCCGPKGCC
ncbi:arsenite efflux transporter metallochaperone ArsD [Sulfurospirillum diekertiae]|uniref:Arsenical resistance operon trans-acting repressor ArsD n=1 Tax=Sulfurospirillum diekertiae TaxID=1854492 RepID=A0A1Y0HJG1_9BACT|nr:arsenite efflux transporter metallochaperone ArsD [Sulfurospirillum diekertiae]ARU48198.1 Arsenical resistance operon trans-acting repressor ArsD [Sulfurospirillum diekertiae]ASC93041.1 Arsenical resistance operon trans-acting repressor ArsD [Sulfurospirillum diekertiae]